MGKELVKARVELGKVNFHEERVKASKNSPKDADSSLGSLTLSEESEYEEKK